MVAFVVFLYGRLIYVKAYSKTWSDLTPLTCLASRLGWPHFLPHISNFGSELKTWLVFKIGFCEIFWPQFYFYHFFTYLMILLMILIIYVQFILNIPVDGSTRPVFFLFEEKLQ